MGDTPTSPVKGFALATHSWLSPIRRHLVCGRLSLVRYYAHAEQVPLNLNSYVIEETWTSQHYST